MFRLSVLAVLGFSLLFSCDRRSKLSVDEGSSFPPTEQVAAARSVGAPPPVDRKVIRRGEVVFQTASVSSTRVALNKLVTELKGYLEVEHTADLTARLEYRMVIRVPAENFDSLVERSVRLADKLDTKNISAEDVTEEFIDVEARLRTKKELENRYIELLGKASKVEDVLAIERELGTLRSDIESIEGRYRYLKDRVGMSSLDIVFYEPKGSSFGFGGRVGEALRGGWSNLLDFLVLLINIWPFLLLFAVAYFFYRRRRAG